jgi:hypothetical protein
MQPFATFTVLRLTLQYLLVIDHDTVTASALCDVLLPLALSIEDSLSVASPEDNPSVYEAPAPSPIDEDVPGYVLE